MKYFVQLLIILTTIIFNINSQFTENNLKTYHENKLFSSNLVQLFFFSYRQNFGKNIEFIHEFDVSCFKEIEIYIIINNNIFSSTQYTKFIHRMCYWCQLISLMKFQPRVTTKKKLKKYSKIY